MSVKLQLRMLRNLLPIGLAALLSACAGEEHGDLAAYVREVKARPPGKIEPLPKVEPYANYVYKDADLRDPFKAVVAIAEQIDEPPPEETLKPPEPLEAFPLDTLRMVGSLERQGAIWAIVRHTEGQIYRVKVGNRMGKNFGEIREITHSEILLVETVQDGAGKWIQRDAKLVLNE